MVVIFPSPSALQQPPRPFSPSAPHGFVPSDAAIRKGLTADGSGASYVRFLKGVRRESAEITEQCSRQEFGPEDLPKRLERPESTTAQLIGEYYWITMTRNVKPPDAAILREWLAWS